MTASAKTADAVVHTEARDGVLTVTLADVENRNALGSALIDGLHGALERAENDPAVRVVVLTNEGNTFCAGANLKERSGAAKASAPKVSFEGLLARIQRSETPIVGKIRGHVVGGGNGPRGCPRHCDRAGGREVRLHRSSSRRGAGDHLGRVSAEDAPG